MKPTLRAKNNGNANRGQSTLEALFILPLLLGFFLTGLVGVISYQNYIFLRFHFKESVVCLQGESTAFCRKQFQRSIQNNLTLVHIHSHKLYPQGPHSRGQLKFYFTGLPKTQFEMQFQTQL